MKMLGLRESKATQRHEVPGSVGTPVLLPASVASGGRQPWWGACCASFFHQVAARVLSQTSCHLTSALGIQEGGDPSGFRPAPSFTEELRSINEVCCPKHVHSGCHTGPSDHSVPKDLPNPTHTHTHTHTHTETHTHTHRWSITQP